MALVTGDANRLTEAKFF